MEVGDKNTWFTECLHIERFELFLGKLPVWKDKFYQLIDQREEIMERIQINSMDKRIAKLKESHLII